MCLCTLTVAESAKDEFVVVHEDILGAPDVGFRTALTNTQLVRFGRSGMLFVV
jgi:hypothetical protein